jgi:hypothetical protein
MAKRIPRGHREKRFARGLPAIGPHGDHVPELYDALLNTMSHIGGSRVRNGLVAGGTGIRTRFRDGSFRLCGTSRSAAKTDSFLRGGPAVRIRLPPAVSPLRT